MHRTPIKLAVFARKLTEVAHKLVDDARKLVGDAHKRVGVKMQDELNLDQPVLSRARDHVLKRRRCQTLCEHVCMMERCLFVDEGVLRSLDEDFVGDAQRYPFSASKGLGQHTVLVVNGGNALRVVLQAMHAQGAMKRSFHQEVSRDPLRVASRRHADVLNLACTRCCNALLLRSPRQEPRSGTASRTHIDPHPLFVFGRLHVSDTICVKRPDDEGIIPSKIERLPLTIKSSLCWQYCIRRFSTWSWLVFQLVNWAASCVMATVRSRRRMQTA